MQKRQVPKADKIGPKTTVWKASDIAKTLRELTGEQQKAEENKDEKQK